VDLNNKQKQQESGETNKMDAPNQKTTIDDLFSGKRRFSVPSFQRAYSWQVGNGDQVGQFLRDIREQGAEKQYYLGHFLFECESGAEALQVVDGQQRLTTTVVFMSCLVSECKKRGIERLGDVEVEEIAETYLEHRGQKFQTVKEDAAFFLQRIIKCDTSATRTSERKSEGCLNDAAAFFSTAMAAASTDDLVAWYQVLADAIVTTYTIEGEDAKAMSAQIFAFQNDRGKGLTTLEKAKAWMIYQAYRHAEAENASYLIEALEVKFSEIYGLSECLQESEDGVLSWHRQAFIDGWDDGTLDAIKRSFDKAVDKIAWLLDFSARLAQTFRYVYELEQTAERWDGLVADICCLGKTSAMPLLIKLRHFGPASDTEGSQKALALIENILFKLTFQNAGYRTNKLAQFARDYDGTNFESVLLPTLEHAAKHGFQNYWDFTGSCLRYFTENRYHYISEVKYVLYKYENQLRKKRGARPLDIGACRAVFSGNKRVENTLDHIAPQDPDFTTYTNEFQRDYLSDIGNLSLLTWCANASKSNHDPTLPKVRERYNTPPLSQKEVYDILCTGHWGEKEIEERRKRIVDFVIAHWDLEL
jgi:hypothetical protein